MKILSFLLFLGILVSGCASVEFYSEDDLKGKAALKFYNSHPYFLVTNPSSDSSSVSVIYLPDLENPTYVKPKNGIGTAKLELSLKNGMLTSFGNEVDSKVPETIESAASVLGTFMSGTETAEDTSTSFILYKLSSSDGEMVLKEVNFEK